MNHQVTVPGLEGCQATLALVEHEMITLTVRGEAARAHSAFKLAFADQANLPGTLQLYTDGAAITLTAHEAPAWLMDLVTANFTAHEAPTWHSSPPTRIWSDCL